MPSKNSMLVGTCLGMYLGHHVIDRAGTNMGEPNTALAVMLQKALGAVCLAKVCLAAFCLRQERSSYSITINK